MQIQFKLKLPQKPYNYIKKISLFQYRRSFWFLQGCISLCSDIIDNKTRLAGQPWSAPEFISDQ